MQDARTRSTFRSSTFRRISSKFCVQLNLIRKCSAPHGQRLLYREADCVYWNHWNRQTDRRHRFTHSVYSTLCITASYARLKPGLPSSFYNAYQRDSSERLDCRPCQRQANHRRTRTDPCTCPDQGRRNLLPLERQTGQGCTLLRQAAPLSRGVQPLHESVLLGYVSRRFFIRKWSMYIC